MSKGLAVQLDVHAPHGAEAESERANWHAHLLRALPFVRLDDAELAHLRARLLVGHHNNAIEGIEPSPEVAALCEMFLQERAPLPVSEPFVDRFFRD